MQMIKLDYLVSNPNNPRKDIGDLTGLVASIRAHGILQNLTVTPIADGKYMLVIGRRRCAAAREAGIDAVPCNIVEMDEKEQLGVMMTENMQRGDLTPLEQADGFQMMMDLGYSMDEVEEKTGFSETTIRRRLSLLELDRETVEELSGQITLKDLEAVAKIKNPKIREQLLGEYGGNKTLQVRAAAAVHDERRAEAEKELKEILAKDYGIKKDGNANGWKKDYSKVCSVQLLSVDGWDFTDIEEAAAQIAKQPEDKRDKLVWTKEWTSSESLVIYRHIADTEADTEETESERKARLAREDNKRRHDGLYTIQKKMKEHLAAFAQAVNSGLVEIDPLLTESIYTSLVHLLLNVPAWENPGTADDINKVLKLTDDSDAVARKAKEVPDVVLAVAMIANGLTKLGFHNWRNEYDGSKRMAFIDAEKTLEDLGFEITMDELDYVSGTHELFRKESDDE